MSLSVVITGANRGIGLELARQYQADGAQVTALVRNSSAELGTLGIRVIGGIDVGRDDSDAPLREAMQTLPPIDVLINNAGVLSNESLDDPAFDRMRWQLEVNTLGPLRVTTALRPRLSAGSKIVLITSRMGSMSDNSSGGMYGYRCSKAALNAIGVSLAQDLRGDGIAVGLLHPGFVQTDMTGRQGQITASAAAAGLRARIEELSIDNTGRFRHANGETLPW